MIINIILVLFLLSLFFPVSLIAGLSAVQFFALLLITTNFFRMLFTSSFKKLRLHPELKFSFFAIVIGSIVIFTASVLSSFVAIDAWNSFSFGLRYLIGILVIYSLSLIIKDMNLYNLATILVLFAALSVLISWMGQYIPQIGDYTIGVQKRTSGFFNHPNQYAMVLVAFVPIVLCLGAKEPRKIFYWVILALLVYGILLTGSFMNLLILFCFLGGIPLLLLLSNKNIYKWLFWGSPVFILGIYVLVNLLYVLSESVAVRIFERLYYVFNNPALFLDLIELSGRSIVYIQCYELFKENLLLGIGGDNLIYYIPINHAHNLFLNMAVSTGILGLFGVIVFTFGWISLAGKMILESRILLKKDKKKEGFLLLSFAFSLISYFLSNQSSDSLGGTTIYLLFTLLSFSFIYYNKILFKTY